MYCVCRYHAKSHNLVFSFAPLSTSAISQVKWYSILIASPFEGRTLGLHVGIVNSQVLCAFLFTRTYSFVITNPPGYGSNFTTISLKPKNSETNLSQWTQLLMSSQLFIAHWGLTLQLSFHALLRPRFAWHYHVVHTRVPGSTQWYLCFVRSQC